MTELLPCPFCGSIPTIVTKDVEPQGDSYFGSRLETFVQCECGCCLFDGTFHEGFCQSYITIDDNYYQTLTKEETAAAAWNRRFTVPA